MAGKIRWGTFTGAHDPTYTINPGTNEAPALFAGVVSFAGVDSPIMGRRLAFRAPWLPDAGSLNTNRKVLRDGFRLQVQGEAGRQYVVEGTGTPWDRNSWLPVTTNAPGATDIDFTDPAVANSRARFYRVIER